MIYCFLVQKNGSENLSNSAVSQCMLASAAIHTSKVMIYLDSQEQKDVIKDQHVLWKIKSAEMGDI